MIGLKLDAVLVNKNSNNNNNNNINNNNNNNGNNNIPCGSEILGWHAAGDSRVSWLGRTLKLWLATFLGEGRL